MRFVQPGFIVASETPIQYSRILKTKMKGGKTERGKRKGNHEGTPSFFCMPCMASSGKGRMLTMRIVLKGNTEYE
jgi:hypothetical protein